VKPNIQIIRVFSRETDRVPTLDIGLCTTTLKESPKKGQGPIVKATPPCNLRRKP